MKKLFLALTAAVTASLLPAATAGAATIPDASDEVAVEVEPIATQPCDPTQTEPDFRGQVPPLEDVVPDPGPDPDSPLPGERDELTTEQAYEYLEAVDRASDRVITGALDQRSWEGRELRWAIVGDPANLTQQSLKQISKAAQRLRDPRTPPSHARQIARSHPAILWLTANVHGNEESGTEGSLQVLYELADRADCAAGQILDNAIVVLLPVQNPDGRELNARQNAYGFDLNRDWFARTQPETDAKLEMLRSFPGPLFIDAHEMGGTSFFFPPYADPIYHEIPDQSIRWREGYGVALAAEFERQGIDFFTRSLYDLFYVGYGDSVPSVGFNAAGTLFEKGRRTFPIADRAYQQYLASWVVLSRAALDKRQILEQWAASSREAYSQGEQGLLEPNQTFTPGNEVETEVPERPVRHYFIRATDHKRAEAMQLVRSLQRMDVEVYRLRDGVRVPDYTPYGGSARSEWVPAGTWYVPMAQGQKHWVQAMLHEDTYVPFPYFFDATAWSLPLLANLRGGYSGQPIKVKVSRVSQLDKPQPFVDPANPPRIALFPPELVTSSGRESSGWLRYLLEEAWGLDFASLTSADIASGALEGYEVVLIPNGLASVAASQLGPEGEARLREWVHNGGHLISWRGGTELAAQLGLTSAVLSDPTSDVPGSLFEVEVSENSALSLGVGAKAYAYFDYDKVMRASSPDHVAVEFPSADSERWFVSGFARGAEELGGTAAVVDEPIGTGRTTAFSVEPNFRAYTVGFQKILRNALLADDRGTARAEAAGSAATARAHRAARRLHGNTNTIRLSVRPSSAETAEAVLGGFDASYQIKSSPGRVAFLIANRGGLTADQHPFARELPSALEKAGVETIAYRAP